MWTVCHAVKLAIKLMMGPVERHIVLSSRNTCNKTARTRQSIFRHKRKLFIIFTCGAHQAVRWVLDLKSCWTSRFFNISRGMVSDREQRDLWKEAPLSYLNLRGFFFWCNLKAVPHSSVWYSLLMEGDAVTLVAVIQIFLKWKRNHFMSGHTFSLFYSGSFSHPFEQKN